MTTFRSLLRKVHKVQLSLEPQLSGALGALKSKVNDLREKHPERQVTKAIGSLARKVAEALEDGTRTEAQMVRTTVSSGRKVHVWDVATGRALHVVELPLKEIGDGEEFVAAHEAAARAVFGRTANLKYTKDGYGGGCLWVCV